VLKEMKNKNKTAPSVTSGTVGKARVVHIASGMGVANAARAATVLCERYSPTHVVSFGICGAYPGSGLAMGDIVMAEKEVYADTGLILVDGFHGVDAIGIELLKKGGRKFYNEFPLDVGFRKRTLKVIDNVSTGVFATVNATSGTMKRAKEIRLRSGAICENMEGAAVAHVCAGYGVPVLELRGISNILPGRKGWDKEGAAENCQKALIKLLGSFA